MPRDDTQVPKRQKLRSTCDKCGTANAKCDRCQPKCTRCISHDMECIHGISRKVGKPRREKLRPNFDSTINNQRGSADTERRDSSGCNSYSSINKLVLDLELFSRAKDTMATWETVTHGNSNTA